MMKIIGYINVIGFKYSDNYFYSIDFKEKLKNTWAVQLRNVKFS